MGSSPSKGASKGASNKIEPVLSRSESWSTLDGFVACETGMDKQEALAVNTTVNDKEIKQVKTWMDFPGRKPKSTLNLDVHLSQSVHRKKHQNSPHEEDHSAIFYSQDERSRAEQQNKRKQLLLEHSLSRTNVAGHYAKKPSTKVSFEAQGRVQEAQHIRRQATKMYVQKQKSRMGHDMIKHAPSLHSNIGQKPVKPERQMTRSQDLVKSPMDDSEERLDVEVDALNNITRQPTDVQIKRQIQRWKTEFSLRKVEEQPTVKKARPKPKQSKSFYDLRKAMANRESVSLEHSSVVIKPMPRENNTLQSQVSTESLETLPSVKLLSNEDPIKDIPTTEEVAEKEKSQITLTKSEPSSQETKNLPNDEETKIYAKDNFNYMISRDSPPGFEISLDLTELDESCNGLVEKIQAKAAEVDFRNEIDETLKLWKSNGFLKSIEDFVLSVAPGSNYSAAGEVAQAIAPSNADYLGSLSGNEIHIKMAKAYALYCWIAHCNITSMLAAEEEQYGFSPEIIDVESKSASFDHCTLFVKLSFHVDLEAAVINGQVRTWKKLNEELNFPSPHSWNAVKIGDVPLLLDCFFGSGCVNDSFLGISKAYTPDYFGTLPQQLILTHLPHDPEHQFLEHPLSVQDLQPIIPVPITTMRQGISPLTWSENLNVSNESQYPIVSVDLEVSNLGTMISADLTPGPEINVHEVCFDQNVQLKRNNNLWNIKVAIPLKGRYSLNIYCKPHDTSPDGLCLSYIIHAETDSELKLGYPKLHEVALTSYGLNLIHWNSPQSYMCQNLSGLFNLVFEAKSEVTFDHFILPGRVAAPNTFTASNVKRYNTMLFSNKSSNTSLHQLQAVFPSNGWWTVEISGALPPDSNLNARKYTPLVTYYVYVTVGLPRNSYPHVLSPDVTFNSTRPINATGEELFTVQFATSKLLDLHHYLTFDQVTSDPEKDFSKIDFEGKIRGSSYYVYSLKVIFSQPGIWYIHVFGKEKDKDCDTPKTTALFKINADVKGAKINTSFINYKDSIGESFGIRLHNDGLLTFPDNGQPLRYSFEALSHVNFFHAIKTNVNEMFSRDYCTYLSSEPCDHATEPSSGSTVKLEPAGCTYTIHAVFPENGKWLVQLFGVKEGSTNYSLVFTLNVSVSCSSPQLCYPKLNQAFHHLNMSIDTEHVLIKKNCEDGEFLLPFKAPDNIHFTWSVCLTSAGDKMNSNAFIHRSHGTSNRTFQVVFPKPGEWLVRLFAKESTESSSNFHSVLEFCLTSLSSKSGVSFPQIFEAFYSTFGLQFDMKHLPLTSEVSQLPAKVLIPIRSSDPDVLFWHDIDVKSDDGENNEIFNLDDQCKMISDPSTGEHKLMVEMIVKGKWTVSLYAKKSNAVDKSWTAILKFEVTAL